MFDNIGRKIKTLAKVLCWIEIISSIIVAIIMIYTSNTAFSYRESDSLAAVSLRTSGWILLFGGPLISWISFFVLYALGEITENSATQAGLIRKWAEREGIAEKCAEKNEKTGREKEEMLLMKCPNAYYDEVCELLISNGIISKRIARLDSTSYMIYVRPVDFQRSRALIAERFKDNLRVMKELAPETAADN